MTDDAQIIEALDARAKRRDERRDFFKAFGAAAAITGGVALAGGFSAVEAQTAPTDNDVLNFALNLEYLEAQFYYHAVFGTPLPNTLLTGSGTQGAVISTGAGAVPFTDPAVRSYAREIANNERAHVEFIRTALAGAQISQPTLDISATPTSAFSAAARSAGLIGAGATFSPYTSDENFLLGAFLFEDVGVTAYKGASVLLTSKTFLEAAAGILAVEAYHASILRTSLYAKGIANPMLIDSTEAISTARDSLDGADDRDQGVRPVADPSGSPASNIAPLDANGLAFSRSTGQVLNIVYLNRAAVTGGGFFPNGVNGTIRTSAAN